MLIFKIFFGASATRAFQIIAFLTLFTGSEGSGGGNVQVTSVPASLVPYSLSFSARVSAPRPVSKVESKCPLDPLQYLNTEQTQATVGRVLMILITENNIYHSIYIYECVL